MRLPTEWGRNYLEALGFVKDQIGKKLRGWKRKLLSTAGKETLLKVVAFEVPTYSMSVLLFLRKWCEEVDCIIARFWWAGAEKETEAHWKRWNELTKPK